VGGWFPLPIRVWPAGGSGIAQDVAVVYSGNTVGSIVGSWLPGFVLMPLIGMERTLHVGIVLNMLLALAMLIAGAAEPEDASDKTVRGEGGKKPGELPMWTAVTLHILAPAIPALEPGGGGDYDGGWPRR